MGSVEWGVSLCVTGAELLMVATGCCLGRAVLGSVPSAAEVWGVSLVLLLLLVFGECPRGGASAAAAGVWGVSRGGVAW